MRKERSRPRSATTPVTRAILEVFVSLRCSMQMKRKLEDVNSRKCREHPLEKPKYHGRCIRSVHASESILICGISKDSIVKISNKVTARTGRKYERVSKQIPLHRIVSRAFKSFESEC